MFKISLCLALIALAAAHSTKYNVEPEECLSENPPPIQSYHFHVNFMEQNETETAIALLMREKFIMTFASKLAAEPCKGFSHQPQLCLYEP